MFTEVIKAFFLGVIQGITEWFPVSSTGHMILFNEYVKLNVTDEFWSMFEVVIQFGSILAVVVLYLKRLLPFGFGKSREECKKTWSLWGKIVIACLPAAVVGFFLDDWLDEHLYNYLTVGIMLIAYGILFIVIERLHKNKTYSINSAEEFTPVTALKVGLFQLLSFIPGTSRSGSTILGGMCSDVSRTGAAEFSFFLAVPIMFGASFLKLLKYFLRGGVAFSALEISILITGVATAFLVSLAAIRVLMNFVRKHSFEVFGWYRIVLGTLVIINFIVFR